MTNQEAIKWIENRMCYGRYTPTKHNPLVIDDCFEAGGMAIRALEREPLWVSEKARKPKYEEPVLVVNYDGLYAIAIWHKDKGGNWSDCWMIMCGPYDSGIWIDDEHGTIKAWCELPNIPTFAPFSVEQEPCEDAVSREAIFDDLENNWDWETIDGITATTVLKQVMTDIRHMPSVRPQMIGGEAETKCSKSRQVAKDAMNKVMDEYRQIAVDWDAVENEIKQYFHAQYGKTRNSDVVDMSASVLEIINKYRNGGQDG